MSTVRSYEKDSLSIIVPVYEEEENIEKIIRILEALVLIPHEVVVIYDLGTDNTLPVVQRLQPIFPNIRLLQNKYGRGVVNAIKTGFYHTESEYVCLYAGDNTDQPEAILRMWEVIHEGYDVVSGSRYIPGGKKYGGPQLQTQLSRLGNWLFRFLTDFPLSDATYSFKMYRASVLDTIDIESDVGWVISLEIVIKAALNGFKLTEIPTVWVDRQLGVSKFRLSKWFPSYLKWFFLGIYRLNKQRLKGRCSKEKEGGADV